MAASLVPVPGIVVLCGRSFSGKSTMAAEAARRLHADVISLDAINAERNLRSGAGLPVEQWAKTFEMAQSRARVLLDSGATVIVDDTSSPRFLRDAWRRLAAETRVRLVLVYVNTPVEVSLERHAANRGVRGRPDVDDEVLREHLESFETPTQDEDPICHSTADGNLAETLDRIERRLASAETDTEAAR